MASAMEAALRTEPYQRLYENLDLREIREVADLARLPVLDRPSLAAFPTESRMAMQHDQLIRRSTSGTTGDPIESVWSADEGTEQDLLVARQLEGQGVDPHARFFFINVVRSQRSTEVITSSGRRTSAFTVASAATLANQINAAAPDVLWGEPSLLLEIAEVLGHHPLTTLITDSEVLEPEVRRDLQTAFGVDPLDVYDSWESGFVSWQCPLRSGYHINADAIVLEILDDGDRAVPPGEEGEVVVTNLWNLTTPLIRYRTGDIAALLRDPCPCGVTLPLMSQVEGRRIDWVVARDGRLVSPLRFGLIDALGHDWEAAVRRYRIVQRETDGFLVQVEWKAGRRDDLVEKIAPTYAITMGYPVRVEVEDVDRLPRGPSGKFRLVESSIGRVQVGNSRSVADPDPRETSRAST
jgi:phenylacetate-CoA ligase